MPPRAFDTFKRRLADQNGQSLIIVMIAMFLMIGMAAMAIDVSSWYQKRHRAQVVADAAALAAANCLAHPTTSTGTGLNTTCTSSTDTSDATTLAEAYASANGVTVTSGQITINTTTTGGGPSVKVNPTNSGPTFFAGLFGLHSINESASATAGYSGSANTSCANAGSTCAAVFAMGTGCGTGGTPTSTKTPPSPIIFGGSSDTINGLVYSNGSIYEAGGGGQTLGATTFGNGTGCQIAWSNESGDTWGGSSTRPTVGTAPLASWPVDYTTVVTPCGTGYSYTCTGPGGTPSYCTQAAANYDFGSGGNSGSQGQTQNQVWCAYGTGTPSKPSTWNGLIDFQYDSGQFTGNWFGGAIEFDQNGWTISAQLSSSFPTLYATDSGNCSGSGSGGGVCMNGGGQTVNGSIFAPNGWVEFNGAGSSTSTGFIEAQGVYFDGGTFTLSGTGPTSLSAGSGTGTDSLTG